MRIALAQIRSGTDPTENLGLVEEYTGRAAEAGASLVLFPEATMVRFGVSLVASALGEVLISAGDEPELLVCDIDLDAARKARETVAVMHNRSGAAQPRRAQSLA